MNQPRVKIKPSSNSDGTVGVEIVDIMQARSVTIDVNSALELLKKHLNVESKPSGSVDNSFLELGSLDTETVRHADDWHDHNWSASLAYYNATRKLCFADVTSNFVETQRSTLKSYAEQNGPPPTALSASLSAVSLPTPEPLPIKSVGDVMKSRRSFFGPFPDRFHSLATLSTFLWHGTKSIRRNRLLVPDADLLHTLDSFGSAFEVFVAVSRVSDLDQGFYFYDPSAHALELIREGNQGEKIREALSGQPGPYSAACTLFFAVNFERYQWRYRHERALRELYVSAGFIVQDAILIATALDMRTHISPAIRDSILLNLLNLAPTDWQVLHSLSVG